MRLVWACSKAVVSPVRHFLSGGLEYLTLEVPVSVSLRRSDHWRHASLVTFHLRLSLTIKLKYLSILPQLTVGLRRPNANMRKVTLKLTSCDTRHTQICVKSHTLMENVQTMSEFWLGEHVLPLQCVLDWSKTLEELQINSSDFRQSLCAPLVYEPVNSVSQHFWVLFSSLPLFYEDLSRFIPVYPSLLSPCEIIFLQH